MILLRSSEILSKLKRHCVRDQKPSDDLQLRGKEAVIMLDRALGPPAGTLRDNNTMRGPNTQLQYPPQMRGAHEMHIEIH